MGKAYLKVCAKKPIRPKVSLIGAKDAPNSVRPEIGIYVGDQEPGPAQEIGKKRGKARVDVEEMAREAGKKMM